MGRKIRDVQTLRLQKANKATTKQLSDSLPDLESNDSTLLFDVCKASDLSSDDRHILWQILEGNMRDVSINSSLGWHPVEKREEFFNSKSRFLIARTVQTDINGTESGEIQGFSTFRFEREEGEIVVYCYELQVRQGRRRSGLGTKLLEYLVTIGRHWRMKKIMLTVLKVNDTARRFYEKSGFKLDPTSPEYPDSDDDEVIETDYEILSKPL